MAALALNTTGLVAARLPRKASRGTTGRRSLVTRAAGADDDEKPTARSVLSFLCPLLKVFGGGDAAAPRNRTLEVATSGFASIARLPFGSKVDEACIARPAGAVPKEPIILYEFEACPFCRRVREALSQLDLTVEVRPCPKDAVKHRTEVEAMGGKLTFPFLVDPNTEAGEGGLYESEDICRVACTRARTSAGTSTPLTETAPSFRRGSSAPRCSRGGCPRCCARVAV